MVKKLSIRAKAIKVIECLCFPDFKFKSVEDLQVLLYKFAHIADGSCKNKHKDWVTELEQEYQNLVDSGFL